MGNNSSTVESSQSIDKKIVKVDLKSQENSPKCQEVVEDQCSQIKVCKNEDILKFSYVFLSS